VAIAVTPGRRDDGERPLSTLAAIALGIVIGLFVYAMLDAYLF
jgi:hypothetical protein